MPEPLVVVAAAIVASDLPAGPVTGLATPRVLAAQRSYPAELAGRWELPGGKVEPGETEPAALQRECREELGIDLDIGARVGPDVATTGVTGVLRVYWARIRSGEPVAMEHSELRWLTGDELAGLDWVSPGDREIVESIRHSLDQ
jgi:8-oxo-dGTP diphosphatase